MISIDKQDRCINELFSIIHKQIPDHLKNNTMSLADILRREGFEKRPRETHLATARKMLRAGSDPVFVINITGLSPKDIDVLKKKLLMNRVKTWSHSVKHPLIR